MYDLEFTIYLRITLKRLIKIDSINKANLYINIGISILTIEIYFK